MNVSQQKKVLINIPHRRGGEPLRIWYPQRGQVIFPTGVGVNRWQVWFTTREHDIPHRRGGEPLWQSNRLGHQSIFPTGVGVNRALSF